jgi:hypothetical protein
MNAQAASTIIACDYEFTPIEAFMRVEGALRSNRQETQKVVFVLHCVQAKPQGEPSNQEISDDRFWEILVVLELDLLTVNAIESLKLGALGDDLGCRS